MRILATLGCCAIFVASVSAQQPDKNGFAADSPKKASPEPIPVTVLPAQAQAAPALLFKQTYTSEQLLRMEECELLKIYKCGIASPVPCGYTSGTVIYKPGSRLAVPGSKMFKFTAWQGKYITGGTMTNRQFGLPGIKAAISDGTSWIDGKPSLIFDYEDTSLICGRYRDEVREVSPGIYLGCMHKRTKEGPEISVWFALDARKLKGMCSLGK